MTYECHEHGVIEDPDVVEHEGELTPTKTFHCPECFAELGDTGDGESVTW